MEYLQRYPVDVGQEYMPSYMQTLNAGSLYDKLTSTQAPVPCQPALLEAQVCEPVGAFADGTKGRRGDSSALVFVTCVPNRWAANRSVVPRNFGRSSVTGPVVVLTVTGW